MKTCKKVEDFCFQIYMIKLFFREFWKRSEMFEKDLSKRTFFVTKTNCAFGKFPCEAN